MEEPSLWASITSKSAFAELPASAAPDPVLAVELGGLRDLQNRVVVGFVDKSLRKESACRGVD